MQAEINAKNILEQQKNLGDQTESNNIKYGPLDMKMADRERLQFITFESMKKNFSKVFGT